MTIARANRAANRLVGTVCFIAAAFAAACATGAPSAARGTASDTRFNVVVVLADDLGWGELSCQGQKRFATPSLDALAAAGVRCTQGYSGNTVCAPSRCAILTGKHMGHAAIRDNGELPNRPGGVFGGQAPLPAAEVTLGERFQRAGYETAFIGKWGMGLTDSEGSPNAQGFDHFYGYLCQRHAHNSYPTYLVRDGVDEPLPGNDPKTRSEALYAPDLMAKDAEAFVRETRSTPFLLVFASNLPHLALQAPPEEVAHHKQPEDPAYEGGKGYMPCAQPRATYAAMVTRLDAHVGAIVQALRETGQWDRTVVIVTSDNGSTFALGGYDPAWFDGTAGLRGHKTNLFEGGIRVPFIVRWPGVTHAGAVLDVPVAAWDLVPTLCREIAIAPDAADADGIDLRPWLSTAGQPDAPPPPDRALYWEFASSGGQRAMRWGDWKAVQTGVNKHPDAPIALFDLKSDPNETTDVSAQHPDVVASMRERMMASRTECRADWDLPWLPVADSGGAAADRSRE